MHALYKRKKALLLVALCCMNSVGSFISATNALSTENISEDYTVPSLEKLPEKIQTIVKGKEKEYGKLLAYYKYKVKWGIVYMLIGVSLGLTVFEILFLYLSINEIVNGDFNDTKKQRELIRSLFGDILVLCFIFIGVSELIITYKGAKYPGAIFLTDTGILFIDAGYNVKHTFIPYTDIKQLKIQKLTGVLKIEFVKNFSDSKGKDIEYSGKVNKITIELSHMPNGLYKKLSETVEKVRTEVIREKAKQKAT